MISYYCLNPSTNSPENLGAYPTRAETLGCELNVGDPTYGSITAWPSIVVLSTATTPQIIPDNTGQATLAQVQTAQTNATNAEQSKATKIANANSALQSVVASLAPGLTQAQTDLNTLASSTDPLAPILARTVQGVVTLAQAVNDALVYLEVIG